MSVVRGGIAMKQRHLVVVRDNTCFVKAIAETNSIHSVGVKFSCPQRTDTRAPADHASVIEGIQNLFMPHVRNIPEDTVNEPNDFVSRSGGEIDRPELGRTEAFNPAIQLSPCEGRSNENALFQLCFYVCRNRHNRNPGSQTPELTSYSANGADT